MRRLICDVIIVICICAILYSGYSLFNYFKDEKESEKIVTEVKEEIKKHKKVNKYRVGWIKIPKTKVDYPVMQRDSYYLHKDYHGKDSVRGCLFVDQNTELPMSRNILIYGHHMMDGTMFGQLVNYSGKDFLDAHKTIYYTPTGGEKRKYEVIAMFKSTTNDKESYLDYADIQDEETYDKYIEYISKVSETRVPEIEYPVELLTLSTCSYHLRRTDPHFHDGRFCVVAMKVD